MRPRGKRPKISFWSGRKLSDAIYRISENDQKGLTTGVP